jgi:hypothetical protein
MGLRSLKELFDEQFYTDMPGGIMQALGQLFQGDLKLYVCPALDATGTLVNPADHQVSPRLRHLYAHLVENNRIESMTGFDHKLLKIFSREVLSQIQAGDPGWEAVVPAPAAAVIKLRGLFGSDSTASERTCRTPAVTR